MSVNKYEDIKLKARLDGVKNLSNGEYFYDEYEDSYIDKDCNFYITVNKLGALIDVAEYEILNVFKSNSYLEDTKYCANNVNIKSLKHKILFTNRGMVEIAKILNLKFKENGENGEH